MALDEVRKKKMKLIRTRTYPDLIHSRKHPVLTSPWERADISSHRNCRDSLGLDGKKSIKHIATWALLRKQPRVCIEKKWYISMKMSIYTNCIITIIIVSQNYIRTICRLITISSSLSLFNQLKRSPKHRERRIDSLTFRYPLGSAWTGKLGIWRI
jgi:hypothetical protein